MTKRKPVDPKKAVCLVEHIQNHLDNRELGDYMKEGRQIPAGKVGCKICEKSIDRIWSEKNKIYPPC